MKLDNIINKFEKLPKKDIQAMIKMVNKLNINKAKLKKAADGDVKTLDPEKENVSIRDLVKVLVPIYAVLRIARRMPGAWRAGFYAYKSDDTLVRYFLASAVVTIISATICDIYEDREVYREIDDPNSITNQRLRLLKDRLKKMLDDFKNMRPIDFMKHLITGIIKEYILMFKFWKKLYHKYLGYKVSIIVMLLSLSLTVGLGITLIVKYINKDDEED